MLDDFFTRALLAGIGVALVAGPLGCFIVWRRLAYFGDTLSHAALLGVALAFLFEVNITLAVFVVSAGVSLALLVLSRRASLSADALLGLLAHSTLALGLVVLAFMTWIRIDLMGFLFGDILAVSKLDVAIIWVGGVACLAILAAIWRPLFAATVSQELAEAEGMRPERANIVFMFLMAGVNRDCHEDRRRPADHGDADYPGCNCSKVRVRPRTDGRACVPDRRCRCSWRPVRLAGVGHTNRSEHCRCCRAVVFGFASAAIAGRAKQVTGQRTSVSLNNSRSG